jgi:hypothetical protein
MLVGVPMRVQYIGIEFRGGFTPVWHIPIMCFTKLLSRIPPVLRSTPDVPLGPLN